MTNDRLTVHINEAKGLTCGSHGTNPDCVLSLQLLSKNPMPGLNVTFETTLTPNSRNTVDPKFNEMCCLDVANAADSQLQVVLWDKAAPADAAKEQTFLGEVLLNVGKLEPYAGRDIEQIFDVRKSNWVGPNKAISGKLFLKLKYDKVIQRESQLPWTLMV